MLLSSDSVHRALARDLVLLAESPTPASAGPSNENVAAAVASASPSTNLDQVEKIMQRSATGMLLFKSPLFRYTFKRD